MSDAITAIRKDANRRIRLFKQAERYLDQLQREFAIDHAPTASDLEDIKLALLSFVRDAPMCAAPKPPPIGSSQSPELEAQR